MNNKIKERKDIKIIPNGFGIKLESDKKDYNFILTFGDIDKDKNKAEILSEIQLSNIAFKNVFRAILDTIEEYQDKTGIDIFEQVIEEYEKEGANDADSK